MRRRVQDNFGFDVEGDFNLWCATRRRLGPSKAKLTQETVVLRHCTPRSPTPGSGPLAGLQLLSRQPSSCHPEERGPCAQLQTLLKDDFHHFDTMFPNLCDKSFYDLLDDALGNSSLQNKLHHLSSSPRVRGSATSNDLLQCAVTHLDLWNELHNIKMFLHHWRNWDVSDLFNDALEKNAHQRWTVDP